MRSKWKATQITFILMVLAGLASITFAADDCDSSTKYLCGDGTTCIAKSYVCNNVTDCPGRDDETDCGKKTFN